MKSPNLSKLGDETVVVWPASGLMNEKATVPAISRVAGSYGMSNTSPSAIPCGTGGRFVVVASPTSATVRRTASAFNVDPALNSSSADAGPTVSGV